MSVYIVVRVLCVKLWASSRRPICPSHCLVSSTQSTWCFLAALPVRRPTTRLMALSKSSPGLQCIHIHNSVYSHPPSPAIGSIWVMVVVSGYRGIIIRTTLCCVLYVRQLAQQYAYKCEQFLSLYVVRFRLICLHFFVKVQFELSCFELKCSDEKHVNLCLLITFAIFVMYQMQELL